MKLNFIQKYFGRIVLITLLIFLLIYSSSTLTLQDSVAADDLLDRSKPSLVTIDDEADAEKPPSQKIDHAVVLGFDRFYSKESKNLDEGGLLLLGDLNCTSCHQTDDNTAKLISVKEAPILNNIGSRVSAKYLRRYLKNPHAEKPGTTMPSMLPSMLPSLKNSKQSKKRDQIVESLVHFLIASSKDEYKVFAPSGDAVSRGEVLYHSIGCIACHQSNRKSTVEYDEEIHGPKVPLMPLGKLEKKYNVSGLTQFLSNPLKFRPSGRMPHFHLTAEEANNIASYLVRDIDAPAAMNYAYYRGSWSKMPNFGKLQSKVQGKTSSVWMVHKNSSGSGDKNNFGYRFDGFINIPTTGDYTFFTHSDDGSLLYLDGKKVVDNDGDHGPIEKNGKVKLSQGFHPIRVEFYQKGGGAEFAVSWQGPGFKKKALTSDVLSTTDKPPKSAAPLKLQAELVKQGRQHFAAIGCASCHQLQDRSGKLASTLNAKPLIELNLNEKPNQGCLATKPIPGLPFYQLNQQQRTAITKAIVGLQQKKFKPRDTKNRIDLTMMTSNCYACHERDKKGGVSRWQYELFSANQKDVGDEGKIPPLLTGIGDKLNDDWLAGVLLHNSISRPYMNARMPYFGKHQVQHLVKDFVTVDRIKETPVKTQAKLKASQTAGHLLTGSKGLSCISCHTFARHQSLGIQVMDLAIMTKRLRRDWFLRYLRDPQEYRPGTRMPGAWPNNKSQKPEILSGDVDQQILAIWDYLSSGKKAKMPTGIVQTSMELIVTGEALIYRNFIKGAGNRAIAVGYPEEVNLAFDAEQMRMALLWQGKFIDASLHWRGRGAGSQSPLGRKVITLTAGAPFAFLENQNTAWPSETGKKAGYQFLGYRLDEDRRPTFIYQFENITVEDYPVDKVQELKPYFSRQFLLTAKADAKIEKLYFRAAAGVKIEKQSDGSYKAGDVVLRFKQLNGAKPIIRNQELLIPLTFKQGKAAFIQEYHW